MIDVRSKFVIEMISIFVSSWLSLYITMITLIYGVEMGDTNFKIHGTHNKLVDHLVYISRIICNNKMLITGPLYAFVFYVVYLKNKFVESHIDVTVDLKNKYANRFWNYEYLGKSYGNYETYLYEMRPGFKCDEVKHGNAVVWSAIGKERAERVVLSGRGTPMKIVEIDLDDDRVLYFQKAGHFGNWRPYTKGVLMG